MNYLSYKPMTQTYHQTIFHYPHLWIFSFGIVRCGNAKIPFSKYLHPDNKQNLTIIILIAESVFMRFAAQNIYSKRSKSLKQNPDFFMFIQVPTFTQFEIHLLKAVVEMYSYTIAIHTILCNAQNKKISSKSRRNLMMKFSP